MNKLLLSYEAILIAVRDFLKIYHILGVKLVLTNIILSTRAREIVGFAGSGPIFETENKKLKSRSIKLCISQDFAIHRLTLSPVRIVHT